jgi:hypothetical protein
MARPLSNESGLYYQFCRYLTGDLWLNARAARVFQIMSFLLAVVGGGWERIHTQEKRGGEAAEFPGILPIEKSLQWRVFLASEYACLVRT